MTSILFAIVGLIVIILFMILYGLAKAETKLEVLVEELEEWVKVPGEVDEVIVKIKDATGKEINIALD